MSLALNLLTALAVDVLGLEVPALDDGEGELGVAWLVTQGGEDFPAFILL